MPADYSYLSYNAGDSQSFPDQVIDP